MSNKSQRSSVLQNSLQLLQEIKSSLTKPEEVKRIKKQSYVSYEEPREQIPELIPLNGQNSGQMTEEIIEMLRVNQKQFDKQCLELERSIKDLVDNIESDRDEFVTPIERVGKLRGQRHIKS